MGQVPAFTQKTVHTRDAHTCSLRCRAWKVVFFFSTVKEKHRQGHVNGRMMNAVEKALAARAYVRGKANSASILQSPRVAHAHWRHPDNFWRVAAAVDSSVGRAEDCRGIMLSHP